MSCLAHAASNGYPTSIFQNNFQVKICHLSHSSKGSGQNFISEIILNNKIILYMCGPEIKIHFTVCFQKKINFTKNAVELLFQDGRRSSSPPHLPKVWTFVSVVPTLDLLILFITVHYILLHIPLQEIYVPWNY